jgi:hypothetical protein
MILKFGVVKAGTGSLVEINELKTSGKNNYCKRFGKTGLANTNTPG